MSILEFLQWVAERPSSIALRESLYVWPWVESTHVLSLGLFAGTAIMFDLRLLGLLLPRVRASEFTGRLLPWTRAGMAIMVTTGLLLFYATPVRNYQNVFFRIKVCLLILAGMNIWYFHSRTHRRIAAWDLDPVAPKAARAAAVISLIAWSGVIVAGRLIAYNWFDCDLRAQTGLVKWLAGCP